MACYLFNSISYISYFTLSIKAAAVHSFWNQGVSDMHAYQSRRKHDETGNQVTRPTGCWSTSRWTLPVCSHLAVVIHLSLTVSPILSLLSHFISLSLYIFLFFLSFYIFVFIYDYYQSLSPNWKHSSHSSKKWNIEPQAVFHCFNIDRVSLSFD